LAFTFGSGHGIPWLLREHSTSEGCFGSGLTF
jgi:hypothetical protein